MPIRLLCALFACVLYQSVSSAQEADSVPVDTAFAQYASVPPAASIYLNEISVWDGLPLLKLVAPASVVDLRLERYRSFHALNMETSMGLTSGDVCKSIGYVGQPCYPEVRGSKPRSVLVLADGIPVSDEISGDFDLSTVSKPALRKAEILRGCGSSIYGPNASGGVVDLVTKKFEGDSPFSSVNISGGSHALRNTEIEFGRRVGDSWKGYFSGQYMKGDGYRQGTDFDIKNFNGDVSHDLGGMEVGTSVWWRDGKSGMPPDTLGQQASFEQESRLLLGSAYVRSKELDARLYYKDNWHENSDTVGSSLGVRTAEVIGAQARKSFTFGRNRVVLGLSGRDRKVDAPDSVSYEVSDGGVTASGDLEVLPLLWVSPGASFWHDELYGSELSPRVSVSMAYNLHLVFFASAGRGFNAPTLSELLSPSSGNEELKSEHVLSYSAGARYEVERLSLILEVFGSETSDLIEPENDSSQVRLNTESIERINGLSLRARTDLVNLQAGANLRVLASEHTGTDTDVPYTPATEATGYAGYRGEFRKGDLGVSLLLEGRYTSERLSENGASLSAYSLLNACAEVRIIDVRLFYRIENMLEEEYESISGYPGSGRLLLYGLEWDFWN